MLASVEKWSQTSQITCTSSRVSSMTSSGPNPPRHKIFMQISLPIRFHYRFLLSTVRIRSFLRTMLPANTLAPLRQSSRGKTSILHFLCHFQMRKRLNPGSRPYDPKMPLPTNSGKGFVSVCPGKAIANNSISPHTTIAATHWGMKPCW